MDKKEKLIKIAITSILLIGGIMFIVTGIIKFNAVNRFPTAVAVITNIEIEEGIGDEADTYRCLVKYAVEGTCYESELDSSKSNYKVGDSVTVHYNPEKPEEITSVGYFVIAVMLGFGVLLLVVGCFAAKETKKSLKAKTE